MFRYSLALALRNHRRFMYLFLLYSAFGILVFLGINLGNIDALLSDPFTNSIISSISNLLIFLSILIGIFGIMYMFRTKFFKQIDESLDYLNVKKEKKYFIIILGDLWILLFALLFSGAIGYALLYLIGFIISENNPTFAYNLALFIFSFLTPVLLYLTSSVGRLIRIYRNRISRMSLIPFILFSVDAILFIFVDKVPQFRVPFFIILVILLIYLVETVINYFTELRITRVPERKYSTLISNSIVGKILIALFIFSYVFLIYGLSGIKGAISKNIAYNEYFIYDYLGESDPSKIQSVESTLATEPGIEYSLFSDASGLVYSNKEIAVYYCDLTMIEEMSLSSVVEGTLINEYDYIVLPISFKTNFQMEVGSTYTFIINGEAHDLAVSAFIKDDTDFIAYSYGIKGESYVKNRIFIRLTDKQYDINALSKKLDIEFSKRERRNTYYYTMVAFDLSSNLAIIFFSLLFTILTFSMLMNESFSSLKPTFKEMDMIPIRRFQVSRMIFMVCFEINVMCVLLIILVRLLSFLLGSEMFSLLFGSLNTSDFILYLLAIFIFYNIIFLLQFLFFNYRRAAYEEAKKIS